MALSNLSLSQPISSQSKLPLIINAEDIGIVDLFGNNDRKVEIRQQNPQNILQKINFIFEKRTSEFLSELKQGRVGYN